MSNKKETQENNNFKSKNHEYRFNKKNKQSEIRGKRNNKNFFMYEDSIVNELPSGSFDRNNKVHPEFIEYVNEEQSKQMSSTFAATDTATDAATYTSRTQSSVQGSLEKKNDIELNNLSDEEYEEYSPDYFEPQVYKK